MRIQCGSGSGSLTTTKKNLYCKDAAERFQEEAGISADMDLSLLDNRIKIRDYIQVIFLFEAGRRDWGLSGSSLNL